jgi:c(7)-type cytochrome triheme protein
LTAGPRGRSASVWLRRLAIALGLASATAALGAAFPAVLRVPRRSPATTVPPRALFSHRTHQSFGCYACHPSLFPQAPLAFTHEEMRAGKFCGRCHDGGVAFAIPGATCARCHVDGP